MAFPGKGGQGRGVTEQQCWNLPHHSHLSTLLQGATSVYSEDIALNLVAQLGLEVTQFLLQARERGENDGFWAQRSTGLHVVVKPEVTGQRDKSQSALQAHAKPESTHRAVPAHPDPPQGDMQGIPTSIIPFPTGQQSALPLYNHHL